MGLQLAEHPVGCHRDFRYKHHQHGASADFIQQAIQVVAGLQLAVVPKHAITAALEEFLDGHRPFPVARRV